MGKNGPKLATLSKLALFIRPIFPDCPAAIPHLQGVRAMAQQLASVCPLDCPDTCSLHVTVESGRISKVRGSDANPLTQGAICNKVAQLYPEFVHGPNRIAARVSSEMCDFENHRSYPSFIDGDPRRRA